MSKSSFPEQKSCLSGVMDEGYKRYCCVVDDV